MTTKSYIHGQLSLFGEAEIIGFGSDDFYIKEIPKTKARAIIIKNHYSKKVYAASTIHLGCYFNKKLIGVLQYGFAMNPSSMDSVVEGTKIDEYLELNRMWFEDDSPPNCKSMSISYSIKFIKRKYPKIKWIQSFADERCKKFGIVYQAANFIYCGGHESVFWEIDNDFYHNSLMTRNPKLCPSAAYCQSKKEQAIKHTFKQFRYIYFINKKEQKNLRHKVLEYPKHYISKIAETG